MTLTVDSRQLVAVASLRHRIRYRQNRKSVA